MCLQLSLQEAQVLSRILNAAHFFRPSGYREYPKPRPNCIFSEFKALRQLFIIHFQERRVIKIDPSQIMLI